MPIEKPHVVSVKGGVSKVVRENPMLRITGPQGTVIAQNGHVMYEDGTILDPVPDWFWEVYSHLSEDVQTQVGVAPTKKSK